jgi:hypothetical protein
MRRFFPIAVLALSLVSRSADATLVFDGIIDDVTVTRTPIGGGFDSLVIKVDVGSDTFDTLDGGFVPLGGAMFKQTFAPDATPPKLAFDLSLIPPDDTTFLLPRDFGDPTFDGPNTDTTMELSSLSISYSMPPLTGMFELARLVVPSGADAAVIGKTVTTPVHSIPLISSGMILGKISGDTIAPIPEANVVVAWLVLASGAVVRWRWNQVMRFLGGRRPT